MTRRSICQKAESCGDGNSVSDEDRREYRSFGSVSRLVFRSMKKRERTEDDGCLPGGKRSRVRHRASRVSTRVSLLYNDGAPRRP